MLLRRACAALAVATSLAVVAPRLSAQVGTTTDILTGTVTGPDGHPLADAQIEVTSIETDITRRTRTNDHGRYTVVFPDGGGQYRLVVRFLGMAPLQVGVARQADEDRLETDVRLSPVAERLATVTVRGRSNRGGNFRTPGSNERDISSELASRLPIDASDLNVLATLAPGVVGIDATDSTNAAFSVAGLRPTANNVTLDGLSFGSGAVPQDAVRSTQIVTSTYDVARGEFSGGLVASTTRGGSNVPSGSFTYTLRDRSLAWGAPDYTISRGYTQNQLGGGFGGPIVRDKLFAFGAVQGRWRTDLLPSLLNTSPYALQRVGVSPDSLARFLSLVNGLGVQPDEPGVADDRSTDNVVGLVRLDWLMSDANTLMIRGDWHDNRQDPTRVSTFGLPQTGGTSASFGGGLMGVLTSYVGGSFINELRAYVSRTHQSSTPFLALPAGRVLLASDLADSLRGVSSLMFGGGQGMPQQNTTSALEMTEELSWLQPSGAHRIKLGAFLNRTRYDENVTTNSLGTFYYATLGALEANQPSEFTRTLAPQTRTGTNLNEALYLGDIWRPSRVLQLTYGARLEGSQESGAPAYNPLVDSLFDRRTDQFPSEVHVSPRLGFTAFLNGRGGPGPAATIVRGGVGEFRSPAPTELFASAENANGLPGTESQLVCVGAAVPTPDWTSFAADPASIPTQCVPGEGETTTSALPNVVVFDPRFQAPRAWRASLGVQHRLLDRMGLSIDASYARGVSQYGFADLNLDTVPKFRLANEGNRPVYVDPSSIDPSSGVVNAQASRLHPELGDVIDVLSDLGSESTQLTIGLNGFTDGGAIYQVSYTYSRARDQSSFSCCSAMQGLASPTTGGNPDAREWATSDYERRHSFLATLTMPLNDAIELTTIARMSSGASFTPLVGSDINGDGLRNDRAFIFDPANTQDTAVASAMRRLLATAPSSVRDCLAGQLDHVANRNSCTGPWQPALDFQVNVRPAVLGLDRRLTLSIVTVNLIAGIDELLHGENGAHGWGAARFPDNTLLYVRGFDAATGTYEYAVNERFGSTASSNGIRIPFQIGFQAHYALGSSPFGNGMRGMFGGGRGGRGAGGPGGPGGMANGPGSAADFADRMSRALPNPIASMLAMGDSLQLTNSQTAKLTVLSDSLAAHNARIADDIRSRIQKAGANPDPRALLLTLRPRLIEARQARQQALAAAKAVLTDIQWNKLPDDIKSAGGFRRGP